MELVVMTLAGQVNKQLVGEIQRNGGRALGISGLDGGLLRARRRDAALGRVGDVYRVTLDPLNTLTAAGYIPVIAPVALGDDGHALNVNADTAAAEIAAELGAAKAIFLTDVPGVLNADKQLVSELSALEAKDLIAQKVISGGMIPKVEACLRALAGVERSHIIDGRVPHALIGELFTDRGVGTMITRTVSVRTGEQLQEVRHGLGDPTLARA
jgi:acetylglutamate kinase